MKFMYPKKKQSFKVRLAVGSGNLISLEQPRIAVRNRDQTLDFTTITTTIFERKLKNHHLFTIIILYNNH